MRKLLVVLTLVSFFVAGTAMAGEFGAPAPYTKEGQFSAALGYSYSDSKVKLDDRGVIDKNDQKFVQNQVYVEGGYGFMKNWEAFVRLGGADFKGKGAFIDNTLPGGTADFSGSMKFFGTLGFRGLFYVDPSFSVGAFLQGSYFSETKDADAAQSQFKVKTPWEVDFGIAAQTKIGSAVVYAGPFFYMFRAKIEDTDLSIPAVIGTTKIKEKTPVGGFAGVRIPFGSGYYANFEAQYKSGGLAAVSVGKTF